MTWPERTPFQVVTVAQPAGSSASSMSMLGMSSLMANLGPQRVQISRSPSRRRGALPIGQTRRANNSSFTMNHPSFGSDRENIACRGRDAD